MGLLFRTYRESDLDALVTLDAACFEPVFLFDRESMRSFAEAPNAIVLLAETEDGLLAGFILVHLERYARSVRGYVLTLDVATAFRRTGLASQLMERAEEQAASAGAATMQLEVYAENDAAIRFYETRGYRRTATRRNFYGADMHAFSYRKNMPAAGGA
jgi:ribosomal-protein-alanine N-acetyltransferase